MHNPWQVQAEKYQEEARRRRKSAINYVNWRRKLHWWEVPFVLGKLHPQSFDEEREWAKYKMNGKDWVAFYG